MTCQTGYISNNEINLIKIILPGTWGIVFRVGFIPGKNVFSEDGGINPGKTGNNWEQLGTIGKYSVEFELSLSNVVKLY